MGRTSYYFVIIQIILIVACIGCRKIYEPIEIQGRVVDIETSQPIPDAEIRIVFPEDLAAITFSNENGEYLFEEVNVDSIIDISLQATKQGFESDLITLLAAPETPLTVPALRLKNLQMNDDEDPSVPGSRGSALVSFVSKTKDFIQVQGTGGDETVDFEFVVRDSSGTLITDNNAVYVKFEISAGPGGGEFIYPDSTLTSGGSARATLVSGNKAGVVQIRASINRNGIRSHSSPVPVTISGGLPNINHFEVDTEFLNIPARSNRTNTISVLLGDKHGNPVIPGTAVYFGTNKGTIDGSANTDNLGYVTSQLRTNNTSPGFATVQVETVDENSSRISKEIDILFSGAPKLLISPQTVDLTGFNSQVFKVVLSDENDYPLAAGTTLEVTVDHEDLSLTGTTSVELTDTQRKGNGATEFEFQLRNPQNVTINDDVRLSINTSGPNGSLSKELLLEVVKAEPADPGSIFLADISSESIGVRATGQREDTQLTFQVVDVNGNPLTNENAVDVHFSFGNRPNDDEFLHPASIKTNNLGQATVTLTSGTGSGTVQVYAQANANGRTLRSVPVSVIIHAGHPSQEHFSILVPQRNINATTWGSTYEISVLVGDRYSNFVRDGTAIYFATDGGIISGSALTVNGRANAELIITRPLPPNGFATIGASSADHNQVMVHTTTHAIFSYEPIITVTPDFINLADGDDQTFHFTVKDINGNPMVEGTSIKVEVEGTDFEIIGDTDVTLRDVNSNLSNIKELTEFSFNIRDSDPGNVDNTPIIITIEVEGPNGYAKRTIEGRKEKSF